MLDIKREAMDLDRENSSPLQRIWSMVGQPASIEDNMKRLARENAGFESEAEEDLEKEAVKSSIITKYPNE